MPIRIPMLRTAQRGIHSVSIDSAKGIAVIVVLSGFNSL